LQLNGTHQLLVYADDVLYWEEATYFKENAEALIVASKDVGYCGTDLNDGPSITHITANLLLS
jgi:hypothetical protein